MRFIRTVKLALGVLFLPLVIMAGCSDSNSPQSSQPPPAALALSSPARLDINADGDLVVTDFAQNRFCLVDKATLDVKKCFAAKGQPSGVAYADYRGGRYFVGNRSVRSVDIFDAQGTFLGHLGGKTGLFGLVNDLAVNVDDEFVYVLDSKNVRIDVYDMDGNLFVTDFTSGGLERPSAVEFGRDGLLYVSDFGNPGVPGTSTLDFAEVKPSIWVFDQLGNLVDTIVGATSGGMGMPGQSVFSTPQGLFIDATSNVFVVDALSGEIQVYNLATKNQVNVIGSLGTGEGELFYPLDVWVDPSTLDMFVTDNQNSRITVYRGGGVIP